MEETISLQEIFAIMKNKLSLIISTFFIVLGVTALVTFFLMKPTYSSSTQLIAKLPASTEGVQTNVNDVNFNLQMINTYKDVISSDVVLNEVLTELEETINYNGSVDDIREMLSVAQNTNSQMFSITVNSKDPQMSQKIVNVVSKVFKEKAIDLLSIDKITIMSEGEIATDPVSPNKKVNLFLGAIIGIVLGFVLALLLELLDKTVKDDKYIIDTIGLPILGIVPQMTQEETDAKFTVTPKYEPSRAATTKNETMRRQRSRV